MECCVLSFYPAVILLHFCHAQKPIKMAWDLLHLEWNFQFNFWLKSFSVSKLLCHSMGASEKSEIDEAGKRRWRRQRWRQTDQPTKQLVWYIKSLQCSRFQWMVARDMHIVDETTEGRNEDKARVQIKSLIVFPLESALSSLILPLKVLSYVLVCVCVWLKWGA